MEIENTPLNPENCPWPLSTQLPVHLCEENLCALVVQPANTWTNVSYLIAAIFLVMNKRATSDRYYLAAASFALFIGSTLYHMTGTYWGHALDLGAMLILSGLLLSLTMVRFFHWPKYYVWFILIPSLALSLPQVGTLKWGGRIFLLQIVVSALVEALNMRNWKPTVEQKKWLRNSFLLFIFALIINIMDMRRIYCLPANNFITLHGIWHLICGYCIYLVSLYYSSPRELSKS